MAKLGDLKKQREILEKPLVLDLTEVKPDLRIEYILSTDVTNKIKSLNEEKQKLVLNALNIKHIDPDNIDKSLNDIIKKDLSANLSKIADVESNFAMGEKFMYWLLGKHEFTKEEFMEYLTNTLGSKDFAESYHTNFTNKVLQEALEVLKKVGFTL